MNELARRAALALAALTTLALSAAMAIAAAVVAALEELERDLEPELTPPPTCNNAQLTFEDVP